MLQPGLIPHAGCSTGTLAGEAVHNRNHDTPGPNSLSEHHHLQHPFRVKQQDSSNSFLPKHNKKYFSSSGAQQFLSTKHIPPAQKFIYILTMREAESLPPVLPSLIPLLKAPSSERHLYIPMLTVLQSKQVLFNQYLCPHQSQLQHRALPECNGGEIHSLQLPVKNQEGFH